jgi:hypothetical protein
VTEGYRPGWCIHYRASTQHTTCAAGVNYNDLVGTAPGAFYRMPCFLNEDGTAKPGRMECAHFRPPTAEEVETWKKRIAERTGSLMRGMMIALDEIGPDGVGVIQCPSCKGKLHVEIRSKRRPRLFSRGQCETEGCLSWMT